MIYVGKNYTSRVAGSALRGAYCENCSCEYLYRITRECTGQGTSPYMLDNAGAARRAQEAALKSLSYAIKDFDCVPCPQCGWLQKIMVDRQRSGSPWLLIVGLIGGVIALPVLAASLEVGLWIGIPSILACWLWWILRSSFNPNTRAHTRIEAAGERAILRATIEPNLPELDPVNREVIEIAIAEVDKAKAALSGRVWKTVDRIAQDFMEADRKQRFWRGIVAWGFCGLVGLVAIVPVSRFNDERVAYNKAIDSPVPAYTDDYLGKWPTGPRAEALKTHRDDQIFKLALMIAQSGQGPRPLYDYLKDPRVSLHRDEAKAAIRVCFDDAIKHVETLPQSKDFDTRMRNGLVAVLKAKRDSDDPAVVLHITGSAEMAPVSKDLNDLEANARIRIKGESPKIKQLIVDNPKSDTIIPPDGAFELHSASMREAEVATHLQQVLQQTVGIPVVTFTIQTATPAAPKRVNRNATVQTTPPAPVAQTTPDVELTYHVYPSGDVTGYTARVAGVGAGIPNLTTANIDTERFVGFARIYSVDWSLSFHAPNYTEAAPIAWTTSSPDEFNYKWRGSNPEWGVYSAMLHSANYVAAQTLAMKLGLKPVEMPKSFSAEGPSQ